MESRPWRGEGRVVGVEKLGEERQCVKGKRRGRESLGCPTARVVVRVTEGGGMERG